MTELQTDKTPASTTISKMAPTPKPRSNRPSHFRQPPKLSPESLLQLARISRSERTPFEKRVWSALMQIPQGHFTTYALLATHLGSSPRAVGNALRRNPFAPEVPCHRVIATGGSLGGFKGKWPRKEGEGITIVEKRSLLRGEGVRFAADGKVLGTPFSGFV